jgi:hypothetical protein
MLVERMVDEGRTVAVPPPANATDVVRGFARGENPKVLAGRLGLSVQNHLVMLKDKLGLHEPAELVHYAIKRGHIEAPEHQ